MSWQSAQGFRSNFTVPVGQYRWARRVGQRTTNRYHVPRMPGMTYQARLDRELPRYTALRSGENTAGPYERGGRIARWVDRAAVGLRRMGVRKKLYRNMRIDAMKRSIRPRKFYVGGKAHHIPSEALDNIASYMK